eukprot:GHVU01097660.1.p3 GENE.GHVU01097660.1~~GHVU01097660.1.p3  ORF type:complete len:116 (-),score=9.63 GHVU01097660.1:301-648(-)
MCAHFSTDAYMCVDVCTYVRMYVYMCVDVRKYVRTYVYMCVDVRTYVRTCETAWGVEVDYRSVFECNGEAEDCPPPQHGGGHGRRLVPEAVWKKEGRKHKIMKRERYIQIDRIEI